MARRTARSHFANSTANPLRSPMQARFGARFSAQSAKTRPSNIDQNSGKLNHITEEGVVMVPVPKEPFFQVVLVETTPKNPGLHTLAYSAVVTLITRRR